MKKMKKMKKMIFEKKRRASTWESDKLVLVLMALLCILLIFLRQEAHAQEWPYAPVEDMCPVEYPECLALDFELELERAHMLDPRLSPIGRSANSSDRRRRIQRWEIQAIRVITSGALGKNYWDLLQVDSGAHGFAHFQPPNGMDIPYFVDYEEDDELSDCYSQPRWIDDPVWVADVQVVLYSRYTMAIQLAAWRRGVDHAVRGAQRNGWSEDLWIVAAVVANSTGESGFIRLARAVSWDPQLTVQGYLDQRPDSLHRQRRAHRLRRWL